MTIRLEIVTAERVIFEGDVDAVAAPGAEGEIGVLPKHAALMTARRVLTDSRPAHRKRGSLQRRARRTTRP